MDVRIVQDDRKQGRRRSKQHLFPSRNRFSRGGFFIRNSQSIPGGKERKDRSCKISTQRSHPSRLPSSPTSPFFQSRCFWLSITDGREWEGRGDLLYRGLDGVLATQAARSQILRRCERRKQVVFAQFWFCGGWERIGQGSFMHKKIKINASGRQAHKTFTMREILQRSVSPYLTLLQPYHKRE